MTTYFVWDGGTNGDGMRWTNAKTTLAGSSLLWASSEEGRTLAIDGHRSAPERKMLREAADHFSNGRVIQLVAGDLIIVPSAGFMGRGARSSSEGPRVLHDVANAQLGEEPLRVVTLAKNAFWAEFQKRAPLAQRAGR